MDLGFSFVNFESPRPNLKYGSDKVDQNLNQLMDQKLRKRNLENY